MLLSSIEVALRNAMGPRDVWRALGRPEYEPPAGAPNEPGGPLRLRPGEMAYLLRACMRALDGHHDPLAIDRTVGGQLENSRLKYEAERVHARINAGDSLAAACRAVAFEIGDKKAGEKSGRLEKNYRKRRPVIEAAERVRIAHAAGREPDTADMKALYAPQRAGK